jgi:hypothetical protein
MKQTKLGIPWNPLKRLAITAALIGSASGLAAAQTMVFYSDDNAGTPAGANAAAGYTPAGNLDSIGYDSSTYNAATGATFADPGTISTRPFINAAVPAYFQNYNINGLPTSVGAETLQSVTLFIYAESVNPDGSNLGFTIYDALNGAGGTIPLTLSNANEGNFFSFTLTAAQIANGFSIGATGLPTNALLNVASEENTSFDLRPGVLATYAIPEPSAALLGAVGALVLLRRRRA